MLRSRDQRERVVEWPISSTTPALVHDYLLVLRGAERTFRAMTACWPGATLYTLLWDEAMRDAFPGHPVRTSPLQQLGVRQGGFRRLLPILPAAARRLPVQDHQLVVSSSSAFAHRVRPAPDAVHICYCHSPFRYAWHERDRALAELPRRLRPALRRTLGTIRRSDREASGRVDHFIANSSITRERIGAFWGREASVMHPPVDVDRFNPGVPEDFFLVVCELVRHKRVDVALEAARKARCPIVVVGTGPDQARLEALYADVATFAGRLDDEDLTDLYARARGVVVPNVEEFGIVAVEAMAAGRPVLAADAGGARETVVDGETGVLVPVNDSGALADAMSDPLLDRADPWALRARAEAFSVPEFQRKFRREVDRLAGREPTPRPAAALSR